MMGNAWTLLRALREGRRWSIRQLAAAIGVTREQLGRIEAGRVDNPGWETVRSTGERAGGEPDAD